MIDAFDWYDPENKKFVSVPRVDAIAVYPVVDDDVLIRQQGAEGCEDSAILIPRRHVDALIKSLQGIQRMAAVEPNRRLKE